MGFQLTFHRLPMKIVSETKRVNRWHRLFFRHLGATSVLIQSLMLGMIVGWPTVCLPRLLSSQSPVTMTTDQVSWMMVLLFFGNMLSPVPTGYLMDIYGRKTTLVYMGVVPLATWLLVFIGKTAYELWLAWFLAGVWCGVVYTIVPIYLGEISEPNYRGFFNTLFSVTRRLGVVVEFLSGQYVSYRNLAVISSIFPVLSVFLIFWAPESPYYHLIRNDRISAKESLLQLREKSNTEIDQELNEMEEFVDKQMTQKGRFRDLIATKPNRRALFMMETLIVLQRISETGTVMGYITHTLPKNVFNVLNQNQCVMIIEVARLVTGFASSLIIDVIRRKVLMVSASLICAFSMSLSGTWYFFNTNTSVDVGFIRWVPFVCLMLHNMSYSVGMGPVCCSLRSEYFSMNVKAKSSAITSTTIAFVACVLNKTFLSAADHVGVYINYYIYSFSCLLNAVVTVLFVVETKGKSLKDIQEELNGRGSSAKDALEAKSSISLNVLPEA